MRMICVLLALLCCLVTAAFAEETPEATKTRVQEK